MELSHEVEAMTCVAKGADHGSAPIPQEGRWTRVKEIKDIFGLTHGVGWCAPQQGACKLTLNVKAGIDERPQDHVPADAGDTVEIGYLHFSPARLMMLWAK